MSRRISQEQLKSVFVVALFALLLFTVCVTASTAQTTVVAPVTGQSALTQSVAASGTAANPVQSFTATGSITYYWAGKPVQGTATIRAKGTNQFRLDAVLPAGTRSIVVTGSGGNTGSNLKDTDGKLTAIPLHNTLTFGIPSFPYPQIAGALADNSASISYVGTVTSPAGAQLNQVHVGKTFSQDADPQGIMPSLTGTDYFIDAQSNLVVKIEDQTHPVESFKKSYPHDIELESYTTSNGIAVPTVVREKISGQTIWEFHLSAITFNTTLTDADFTLQ